MRPRPAALVLVAAALGCAEGERPPYTRLDGPAPAIVERVVVTVLSDDNKKYLSTDLLREEPVKEGFLSPRIKLLGFRAFKRVCQTCCDPDTCVADHPADIPVEELVLSPCPYRFPGERS